jgi:hypothetical protein
MSMEKKERKKERKKYRKEEKEKIGVEKRI